MKIVGQVSTPEEAKEMEFAVKVTVVGNRARILALKAKKEWITMIKKNKEKKDAKNKKTIPTEIPIIWVNI